MRAARALFVVLAVVVALLLQTTVFPHLAWRGVVPDVVLLVVVAVGLARGSHDGLVVGFGAGLLLDLAPPADHVAGRWALALMLVGYVAGRVRQSDRYGRADRLDQHGAPGVGTSLATTAACAFLGASVFALSGLLLQGSGAGSVGELLQVVLAAVVWDVVLAPFVIPVVTRALLRLEPERRAFA